MVTWLSPLYTYQVLGAKGELSDEAAAAYDRARKLHERLVTVTLTLTLTPTLTPALTLTLTPTLTPALTLTLTLTRGRSSWRSCWARTCPPWPRRRCTPLTSLASRRLPWLHTPHLASFSP